MRCTWIAARRGTSDPGPRLPVALLIGAALLLAQGPWPRSKRVGPSPVHYYNLAMVQDSIGDPIDALRSLDRAIELAPDRAMFLMRRAHLRIRIGEFEAAADDLRRFDELAEREPLPAWMIEHARYDAATIAHVRSLRAPP